MHYIVIQLDSRLNKNVMDKSNPYFDQAHNIGFTYTNKTGVITRWSNSLSKQDSCINLSFYNNKVSQYIQS